MSDVRGNSGNDLLQYYCVDTENSSVKSAVCTCSRLKQLANRFEPQTGERCGREQAVGRGSTIKVGENTRDRSTGIAR